jgi:glycosyltransferase involved in cell wall biosynthesis
MSLKEKPLMRVLFWSGTCWPQIGGVEVLATKLLQALTRRGHEFIVLTVLRHRALPRKAYYRGIPVYRLPFFLERDKVMNQVMEVRQQIADLKRAFAPDLVHINAVSSSNLLHLTTGNAYSARTLVTLHDERRRDDDSELPVGNDLLMGRLLRAADWISCVSTAVLTEVSRQVPEIIPRSSVIHNALDLPSLLP